MAGLPDPFFLLAIKDGGWIGDFKEFSEAISAWAQTAALGVGAWWTYQRFIKTRVKFPWAELTHEITFKNLTPEKTLIRVSVKVSNTGQVLLPIEKVCTSIHQIAPLTSEIRTALEANQCPDYVRGEINWPELAHREIQHKPEEGEANIEPGESEVFDFDFIVDSSIETISAYSHFNNTMKENSGWCRTTIIDVLKKETN